jgi:hypothetical protein
VSAFSGNRGPELAEAMQHAEDLAHQSGVVELWAQHSDRLARGDGKLARHVVEIGLWALKRDVTVRTVQDPDTFRDLLYAVVTGQRNYEDSRRKSLSVAAGQRRAVGRGQHIGVAPDGYRIVVAAVDERGAVTKCLVLNPERQPMIELLFRLALRGTSSGTIARRPGCGAKREDRRLRRERRGRRREFALHVFGWVRRSRRRRSGGHPRAALQCRGRRAGQERRHRPRCWRLGRESQRCKWRWPQLRRWWRRGDVGDRARRGSGAGRRWWWRRRRRGDSFRRGGR